MTFIKYNFSTKKYHNRDIIVIGPFSGGYGHAFCQYIIALAGLREKNPNAFIICSMPHVFHHYASRFADRMYGFKHNWTHIAPAGN